MFAMTQHLIEAIFINSYRAIKYAKLSKYSSIPYSLFLISTEVLSLPLSLVLDLISLYWQYNKIEIMSLEFISMSKIKSFSNSYPENFVKLEIIPSINFSNSLNSIQKSWSSKNLIKLEEDFKNSIKEIESIPYYYCMFRHLLESGLRCLQLMSFHEEKAIKANLKSPKFLSIVLIYLHIFSLKTAYWFDKQVFKIQCQNIPILYQDVPHIPEFSKD